MEISWCEIIIVMVTVLEMQTCRKKESWPQLFAFDFKKVCTSASLLDSFAKLQVDNPANVTQTRFLLHVWWDSTSAAAAASHSTSLGF